MIKVILQTKVTLGIQKICNSISGVVRITLLLGKQTRNTWRCHGTKFWIPFLHWLGLLSCLGNTLGLLGGVMGLSLGLLLCPGIFLKIIVERECLFACPLACSRKFCNSNHNSMLANNVHIFVLCRFLNKVQCFYIQMYISKYQCNG